MCCLRSYTRASLSVSPLVAALGEVFVAMAEEGFADVGFILSEDMGMGLREREPLKNSSCVGACLMKTLRLGVFLGGLTILQRDRISDCSADGVKSGGITSAYCKDMS